MRKFLLPLDRAALVWTRCRISATALLLVCWFAGVNQSLSAAESESVVAGPLTFAVPVGWKQVTPQSSMRRAEMQISGEGGTGEVAFFVFPPGAGGSVEANVQRWFAQFQNAKTSQEKAPMASTPVTFVSAEGTFLSGMPGTAPVPREGWAMRGAIIELPEGNVFVKLTGPSTVVESARAAFDAMVQRAVP